MPYLQIKRGHRQVHSPRAPRPRYRDAVSEPARIALRLLGLILLVAGVVCAVLLVWPGPGAIAARLGSTCGDGGLGPSHQCSWLEAADLLWTGSGLAIVIGAVLRIVTRPPGRGPLVLDLRSLRRGR